METRSPKKTRQKWLCNPTDTPTDPLTHRRLINWLVDSGWVSGFLKKRIHPLDRPLEADMLQEIWVQILSIPENKLLDIWYKGKGKFTNYLKSLIINHIRSTTSSTFKNTKGLYQYELYLDDVQWSKFEEANEDSEVTLRFPGPDSSYYTNEVFWVEETQFIHSKDKLSEEYNYGDDL